MLREPTLYLSLYFKQRRDEYYRLLDEVRKTGDWDVNARNQPVTISERASEDVDSLPAHD